MHTPITSRISYLVGIMLLVYSAALTIQHYNPSRLHFAAAAPTTHHADRYETPSRMVIPSVGIDTPIIAASNDNNRWELTSQGATYATNTPLPGTPGNSVIYGHNWTAILGPLPQVKPGATIEIYMNDGTRLVYGVMTTAVVDPSHTEVLGPASDRHMTIYTCTGFLDSKRFVVSATLQSQI